MSQHITISSEDILAQVKISYQIPEIVKGILTRQVIASTVAEAGITIETEVLQKAADQFRLVSQLESIDETWAWLEKHSLSLNDFEKMVLTELYANKLAQHLFANKVEPYFFEHQLDYVDVVMYEVVFNDEDLALELFYAVKEGEMSFYEVAHKYIQDTELRRKGGYLGTVRRQDLIPEISAAVFAAKPPQILKPILTSKGVHLTLVEEIIQPVLNEKLRVRIIIDLFSEWIQQQIEKVKFSVKLD